MNALKIQHENTTEAWETTIKEQIALTTEIIRAKEEQVNAAVSPSQKEWVELMAEQGYQAAICLGVDEAMKVLSGYLALKSTLALIKTGIGGVNEQF